MRLIVIDHRGQKRHIRDVSYLPRRPRKGRFTVRFQDIPDLILVGSGVALMTLLLIPSPGGNQLTIPAGLILWVVVAPAIYLTTALRRGRRAARACLEMGVCPMCGHLLAGIEAAADGCVVCLECSAAWRNLPEQTGEVAT